LAVATSIINTVFAEAVTASHTITSIVRRNLFITKQITCLSLHYGAVYSIAGHKSRHGVVYETARADSLDLARHGTLERRKAGHVFSFISPRDLVVRLRER
jgi:hypothetical protein